MTYLQKYPLDKYVTVIAFLRMNFEALFYIKIVGLVIKCFARLV